MENAKLDGKAELMSIHKFSMYFSTDFSPWISDEHIFLFFRPWAPPSHPRQYQSKWRIPLENDIFLKDKKGEKRNVLKNF